MPARINTPPRPCEHCGLMLPRYYPNGRRVPPSTYVRRRFCSFRCSAAVRRKPNGWPRDYPGGTEAKGCELCGTPMHRKRVKSGEWESNKNYKRRRFCDLRCASLALDYAGRRGAKGLAARATRLGL